jgi:hypothetical protein
MLTYNKRADWGASASRAGYADLSKGIIVHWNGPPLGNYSKDGVESLIFNTFRFHTVTRGWLDIAYNFAIDRFGTVWEGRGENTSNAASGDNYANFNYTAVELMIGEGDPFPDAVKQALVRFYNEYVEQGGAKKILCHRDVTPTACPGDEIANFVKTIPNMQSPVTPVIPDTVVAGKVVTPQGTDMPFYIVKDHNGSFLAVYANGFTRTDLTWAEINTLMTKMSVPLIDMKAVDPTGAKTLPATRFSAVR